jgi:sugar/nucleoside kinase (ribokinase family)
MYDVITIGSVTFDIFFPLDNGSNLYSYDAVLKKVCLQAGQKIPVDVIEYGVGGNAANVAVGLSRLGIPTATYLHYGNDEFASKIVETLQSEGVGTEFLVHDIDKPTGIGLVITFQGERTIFVHHIKRNHNLPEITTPKWIYLTSIGDYWENVYKQTLEFVVKNNVALAFSPGSHQFEHGVDSFITHIQRSDILLVNLEEAAKICRSSVTEPKAMLKQIQAMGAKVISITDGEKGAYAIDESGKTVGDPK